MGEKMLRIQRRFFGRFYDPSKTLPEISQFLSECPLSIDKTFSIQEEQKQFQVKLALCKGNDEIMTEFIKFRHKIFIDKLQRYAVATRLLTSDLPDVPLIVPVGLSSVGLNIKEGFQVSLLEQTTWPTLWGCQSYDFDKIQDTLVDNNIECMENRLSINLEQIGQKGILDITKPTHNTNAIFAAQWIHFAMRLNPDIPKYLQVLIGWLEKVFQQLFIRLDAIRRKLVYFVAA